MKKSIAILLILVTMTAGAMAGMDLNFDLSESDKQAHLLGGMALSEFVMDSGGGWWNAFAITVASAYLWELSQGGDGSTQDLSATVSGAIINIAIVRPLSDWIASWWG